MNSDFAFGILALIAIITIWYWPSFLSGFAIIPKIIQSASLSYWIFKGVFQ